MADNENANPQPSAAANGQSASADPATTGGGAANTQGSPWGEKFKSPEDLWNSYQQLESKFGTQGTELGKYKEAYNGIAGQYQDYERAVKAWDNWYKKDIAPHWDRIRGIISGNGQQANPAASPQDTAQQVAQWAQGWEAMSPQQQAERLRDISANYATQNVARNLVPVLQEWQKRVVDNMNSTIAQKEAYFNNYMNLYRKVMDMRMADPNVNVDAVLDNAVRVLSGQQDPLELGRTLATMESSTDAKVKAAIEQARKDWETEQKNKQMAAVNQRETASPPVFKMPTGKGDGKRTLSSQRENVAKALLEKYGPTIFNG